MMGLVEEASDKDLDLKQTSFLLLIYPIFSRVAVCYHLSRTYYLLCGKPYSL